MVGEAPPPERTVKTISPALRTHLANPVTTLATCWHIIRTDGAQFAFTSFDDDLIVDGITYSSTAGFMRTAIQTNSAGQVDNLDLLGFFQEDGGITERDLKNGLFDYASIYVFTVNWTDLSQGICRLRRGWLGECVITPAGLFQAELRGMTQALVQEFGSNYMPLCRADLGDRKCKVPIKPQDQWDHAHFPKDHYIQAATQTTDDLRIAIFQAQNEGWTGSSEPVWNTSIGDTTSDGEITWLSQPYWRGIFSVDEAISQRQFIASLSVPAAPNTTSNTASVSFRDNVSSGTEITVSDGTVSHAYFWLYDQKMQDAQSVFADYMVSFSDWSLTITQSGNTIYFENTGGGRGVIGKVGDTMRGIVILDFYLAPFDGGMITWIDGDNAGRSMEIKTYDTSTGTVNLWLQMNYAIRAGDRFYANPGCDKRRDTCFSTFDNIINFRGEPDMPMFDKVLSYPDA